MKVENLMGERRCFRVGSGMIYGKQREKTDRPEGLFSQSRALEGPEGPHSRDPVHGLAAYIQVPRRKEKKSWN